MTSNRRDFEEPGVTSDLWLRAEGRLGSRCSYSRANDDNLMGGTYGLAKVALGCSSSSKARIKLGGASGNFSYDAASLRDGPSIR